MVNISYWNLKGVRLSRKDSIREGDSLQNANFPPQKTALQDHFKICQKTVFWCKIFRFSSGLTMCHVMLFQSQVGIWFLLCKESVFQPCDLYFNINAVQLCLNAKGSRV